MKPLLGFAAAIALATGYPSAGIAGGSAVIIPHGATVGPQSISGPGTTSFTNYGTINGGTHAGVTATGSPSPSITNNGTITSTTQGISVSGSSTATVVNNGTISATSSSTNASAHAIGINESSGP